MKKFVFILLLFLPNCVSINCHAQKVNENINRFKVSDIDTSYRLVLPLQLEPAAISEKGINKDSIGVVKELIKKGSYLINRGEYALALAKISDAIRLCPKNNIRTLGIAKSYLAMIYIYTNNFSIASKILNCNDTLFRKLGDLSLMAMHFNNLGLYYRENGRYNISREFMIKSLAINRQLQDTLGIVENLTNLGTLIDLPENSIEYLLEAERIDKKINSLIGLTNVYNLIGRNYIALKNYKKALFYLDTAIQVSGKEIFPKFEEENAIFRSEYLAALGKFKEAYDKRIDVENMRKIRNSKFNIEGTNQIIHQREIKYKEYEAAIKDKEFRIKLLDRSLIAVSSVVVMIVLLSLSIYYYLIHKRKLNVVSLKNKLAEKELAYINAEITSMATFLNSRNEILQTIQENLSKISKLPEKEIIPETKRLNLYVKNLQVSNNEVDSIMQKMTEINNEFLQKLSKLHPDLTKNDKNIALLLRANLTTKQIAILMDCSPKSVNMARYRMRIHLNLENDTNLVNYLKEL